MKHFIFTVCHSQTDQNQILVDAEDYDAALRTVKKAYPTTRCDRGGEITGFLKAEAMTDEERVTEVRLAELKRRLDTVREIAAQELTKIAEEAAEELIRIRKEHEGNGRTGLVGDPQ